MIQVINSRAVYIKLYNFNYRNNSTVTLDELNDKAKFILRVSKDKKKMTIDTEMFDIAKAQMLTVLNLTKKC
jgi:hypothetical protein